MREPLLRSLLASFCLLVPGFLVSSWLQEAEYRLNETEALTREEVLIASVAEEDYCTSQLRSIVRRVATSCGLISDGGRGCRSMEAKQVVQLQDGDFNALFLPLRERAKIVQFDPDATDLDLDGQRIIEEAWSDQRGASFFFVVARASADGSTSHNEALSAGRAQSVLSHLQGRYQDDDLSDQVGLLWLGEEFAQLDERFCDWERSRREECGPKEINRSAFVAWIDCRI
ncbi:MAG: hypothetical protein VYD19_03005 [Myxococcota bacterium]|nr:hypothetical protein [Myxococcota bacterium]